MTLQTKSEPDWRSVLVPLQHFTENSPTATQSLTLKFSIPALDGSASQEDMKADSCVKIGDEKDGLDGSFLHSFSSSLVVPRPANRPLFCSPGSETHSTLHFANPRTGDLLYTANSGC